MAQSISRGNRAPQYGVPVLSFPEPSDVVSPWQFRRNGHLLRPSSYPTSGLASTIRYVLWTVYIYGGISAVLYAVSTFIVQPLMIQLTLDRKDFARYVLDRLVNFNIKLSSAVSTIPEITTWPAKDPITGQSQGIENEKDKSSIDGKHIMRYVNVGTQTRPSKENLDAATVGANTDYADYDRKASMSFSGTGVQVGSGLQDQDLVPKHATEQDKVQSPIAQKLQEIDALLHNLANADAPANLHNRGLRYSVEELGSYAENLQYSNFALRTRTRGGSNRLNSDIAAHGKSPVDPANAFRLEIRTIKGALLSARNFPKLSTTAR